MSRVLHPRRELSDKQTSPYEDKVVKSQTRDTQSASHRYPCMILCIFLLQIPRAPVTAGRACRSMGIALGRGVGLTS